jgi:hypothetical protein
VYFISRASSLASSSRIRCGMQQASVCVCVCVCVCVEAHKAYPKVHAVCLEMKRPLKEEEWHCTVRKRSRHTAGTGSRARHASVSPLHVDVLSQRVEQRSGQPRRRCLQLHLPLSAQTGHWPRVVETAQRAWPALAGSRARLSGVEEEGGRGRVRQDSVSLCM